MAAYHCFPLLHVDHNQVPNLKDRYNAEWALVTGGSSGIGRSLCEKLASQGLNIVIVALDDKLLSDTHAALEKAFPALQFRKVGVDLGWRAEYMAPIIEATKDIQVQCVLPFSLSLIAFNS